jgi:hypothetical protein
MPFAPWFPAPSIERPEVDAPCPGEVLDPGTCVPAAGGSTTLCFLGQPERSAAPTINNAIDTIRFIYISIRLT